MGRRLSYLQDLFTSLTSRMAANTPLATGACDGAMGFSRLETTCTALMGDVSETEQLRLATDALETYRDLDPAEKTRFFQLLVDNFSAAPQPIHEAYARYRAAEDQESLRDLMMACEPKRQELLRRLNRAEGGTFALVKMRADLLSQLDSVPALRVLDQDFSHLLKSWFNRGFLTLERIDWSSSASLLEKIIEYEAVHEIPDWDELRKRLKPEDRRCYAFFHPAMGAEPLIFVEVALTRGIPGNIQEILDPAASAAPKKADTAVFYSISNCQAGLKGISFGNILIKQVAQQLKQELPALRQFVTLSPLPGLNRWLTEKAADELPDYTPLPGIDTNHPHCGRTTESSEEYRALGAYYLCHAKAPDGRPYDPVARFHLGNGASLHRVNWPGNCSEQGLQQSLGIMANYLYDLERIEHHYHSYTKTHKVPCSAEIAQQAEHLKQYQASNFHKASSV